MSLVGRLRAIRNTNTLWPGLPALELSTIMAELIASAAVVFSYIMGHQDFYLRVWRRICWLFRCLRNVGDLFVLILRCMLQEIPSDLECQSRNGKAFHFNFGTTCEGHSLMQEISSTQKESIEYQSHSAENEVVEVRSQAQCERVLRQLRRPPSTFNLVQEELRSIGARVRWSAVRYALFPKLQKTPFQDLSLLVAVQGQSFPTMDGNEHLHSSQPLYQVSRRPRSRSSHSSAPTMTSVVMDIVNQNNSLGISQLHPLQTGEQLRQPSTQKRRKTSQPYIQLPGTVNDYYVDALPDTGSSQNVIDATFVSNFGPSVEVHPLSDEHDKPLRAPDGEPIPCEGKIYLPWQFDGEPEAYERWFYVISGCSHDVIIGNGLLRDTETMEKHQHRLKITEPSNPDSLPGNLVCEAQEMDRLRQVVKGKANGGGMAASLDTGCEANLISLQYAQFLDLSITELPTDKQVVTFADGRKGYTLGLVEVDWSFDDTPEISTVVKCYVLPKCIHPIIFGARFVVKENPWSKHKQALDVYTLPDAGDAGVVDLKKTLFSPFRKPKVGESITTGHDGDRR